MRKEMSQEKYSTLLENYRDIYDILRYELNDVEEEQVMYFLEDLDKLLKLIYFTDNLPMVCSLVGALIVGLCTKGSNNQSIHILEGTVMGTIIGLITSRIIFSANTDKIYDMSEYDAERFLLVLEKNENKIGKYNK